MDKWPSTTTTRATRDPLAWSSRPHTRNTTLIHDPYVADIHKPRYVKRKCSAVMDVFHLKPPLYTCLFTHTISTDTTKFNPIRDAVANIGL